MKPTHVDLLSNLRFTNKKNIREKNMKQIRINFDDIFNELHGVVFFRKFWYKLLLNELNN
jgi:hypothetical protein